MAGFSYILNATEYSLSDGTYSRVLGAEGIDGATFQRYEERGPLQDGSTDRGFTLSPRLVTLTLGIAATTPATVKAKRRMLDTLFRMSNGGVLKRVTEDNLTRYLDVLPYGPLTPVLRTAAYHVLEVELKADNPLWRSASVSVALTPEASGETAIPTEIPTEIGPSYIDNVTVINYPGTYLDRPVYVIEGPATNPTLTNQTTGKQIALSGTLDEGDTVTINCRYGAKTIEDQDGNDLSFMLTDDSDFESFALVYDLSGWLITGYTAQSLHFAADGTNERTTATLTYYERYTEA